jgi:hypothetical protein
MHFSARVDSPRAAPAPSQPPPPAPNRDNGSNYEHEPHHRGEDWARRSAEELELRLQLEAELARVGFRLSGVETIKININ